MKITLLVVATLTFLNGCSSSSNEDEIRAPATNSKPFIVGGQIPFWLIDGEVGEPSDTVEAGIARIAIQPRAVEMFDIVIPSALTWNWVEEKQNELDFHRYEWAKDWTSSNQKVTLEQHLFWAWEESKPEWVKQLDDVELRSEVLNHINIIRDQIGEVPRLTVINEMICQSYLEDRLGVGIIKEIFDKTRQLFPNTELFLNEHACPDLSKVAENTFIEDTIENYIQLVFRLKELGVSFDQIGLQTYLTEEDVELQGGILQFVERYDSAVNHFAKETGHKLFITEFAFVSFDENYKASFLRHFFEMALQNSNIEGLIVFHWLDDQAPGSALVNRDGTLTKGGEVFYEIFKR